MESTTHCRVCFASLVIFSYSPPSPLPNTQTSYNTIQHNTITYPHPTPVNHPSTSPSNPFLFLTTLLTTPPPPLFLTVTPRPGEIYFETRFQPPRGTRRGLATGGVFLRRRRGCSCAGVLCVGPRERRERGLMRVAWVVIGSGAVGRRARVCAARRWDCLRVWVAVARRWWKGVLRGDEVVGRVSRGKRRIVNSRPDGLRCGRFS